MELTAEQKLKAFDYRYYQNQIWQPKKGDYYTITRDELCLYQIVDETDTSFYIILVYSNNGSYQESPDQWLKDEFLSGFFNCRLYVPNWILGLDD